MTLNDLNIRIDDLIMIGTFIVFAAGAYWRVMGKLSHLEARNVSADGKIRSLCDQHQKMSEQHNTLSKNAAVTESKLDGMIKVLDRIERKLDNQHEVGK